MHHIKHECNGVVSGRWYKIEDHRYIQFTIENHNQEYAFIATKGYGETENGMAPRQTCMMEGHNHANLRAAEKSFNHCVKEYLYKYPMMSQELDHPLPEADDEPSFLKLVGGM